MDEENKVEETATDTSAEAVEEEAVATDEGTAEAGAAA
jgi:hypothetical protein